MFFLDAQDSTKDIYLYVNTPGGSVSAGLAIVITMNFIKAECPNHRYGDGCFNGNNYCLRVGKGQTFHASKMQNT